MSAKGKARPQLIVDRDDARTSGNVHVKASRRTTTENLDYLLGFQLPPRMPQRFALSSNRKASSRSVPYTRERFVHASYRFVMNPTGDYTAHFCDPDIYHHWPNVLQVIVNCSPSNLNPNLASLADQEQQENFCPICLSEPSAPRMTKCGHVFCYPCLLHLFELSDVGKWVKCPVCADTIHPKDLKSVTFAQLQDFAGSAEEQMFLMEDGAEQEADCITLKLMERPRITTLALPRSASWPSEAVPHLSTPWVFSPDAYTFARFMLATPEYMIAALHKDLTQLSALSGSPTGFVEELDGSFVLSARRKVMEQMDKAEGLKTVNVMSAKKQSAKEISETLERSRKRIARAASNHLHAPVASTSASSSEDTDEVPDIYYAHGSVGGQYSRPPPPTAASPLGQTKAKKNINPPPLDSTFFFYQAASGANIFLHPLDIKILKAHFVSYSTFPDTIQVRVEGREEGSMNEELRRRCRYLGHLPAASDVTFLEVDLEKIVGPKSLEPYANALKMRRNKRRDKVKREDKAKFKSEEKEREKLERDFRTTVHYSTQQQSTLSERNLDVPHHQPEIDDDHFPSMSPPSPSFMPVDLAEQERNRTVWGTRSISSAPSATLPPPLAVHPQGDDWDAAWRTWEAQVASTPTKAASPATTAPEQSSTGRKKAKPKKIVLDLGGARGGRL